MDGRAKVLLPVPSAPAKSTLLLLWRREKIYDASDRRSAMKRGIQMDPIRHKTDGEVMEGNLSMASLKNALTAAADGLAQDPDDCRTAMRNVAEVLVELSRAVARQADRAPVDDRCDGSPAGSGEKSESADSAFRYVQGLPEINQAIQYELDRSRREILTAQPDGPRPELVLQDALDAVRDRIASGVSMRTLYQHSSRFDEPTKGYVRAVTEYGVQIRTLAEFFERLIIVDRTTAFIPANADRTVAVMIREPSVVNFLADVFEREWDRAEPYPFLPVRAAEAASEVIPPMRESIRKLLIEGRSDKEIARRLGISLRTLQAHVAQLKQDHGAEHRLQLGYLMALSDQQTPAGERTESRRGSGVTDGTNGV